jgi:hypothetical protein
MLPCPDVYIPRARAGFYRSRDVHGLSSFARCLTVPQWDPVSCPCLPADDAYVRVISTAHACQQVWYL